MKKLKFLVFLTCMALFIGLGSVNAATYTVEELGEQIYEANPDGSFGYIIGGHVFTSKMTVKTTDIMLAARSINAIDTVGKVNTDPIYDEMVMYLIQIVDYDSNDMPIWQASTKLSANNAVTPATFDIDYIDYVGVDAYNRYNVTFKVDGNVIESGEARVGTLITAPAEDPTKTGYVFAGWVVEGTTTKLDEGSDVVPIGGVTYVATWKKIVNTNSLLEDVATNVTTVDYTGTFDNGVLTLTMLNGAKKLTDISRSGLLAAISGLLSTDGIESITIEYDSIKYVINSTDSNLTIIAKLNSLMVAMSEKNVNDALINDLIGKDFTLTLKLADGYISEDNNQEEIYNVEVAGTKVPESEVVVNSLTSTSATEFWTYINGSFAGFVENTTIAIDSDLKVTGKLVKENIEGFAPAGVKTEGYYFAYTVEAPVGVTDLTNMVVKSGGKVLGAEILDTTNGWVVILKLNKGTTSVSFTIDWDGNGSDYAETTHTFDLSEVVYAEDSDATVAALSNTSALEYLTYLLDNFDYSVNTTLAIDSDLKMTGTVNKENLLGYDAAGVRTEGYYVAYTVELPTGMTKVDVQDMVLVSGNKTLGAEVFDTDNGWVVIFKLADNKLTESITFTIDWDGDGYDYSATTYTIDVSGLTYID